MAPWARLSALRSARVPLLVKPLASRTYSPVVPVAPEAAVADEETGLTAH